MTYDDVSGGAGRVAAAIVWIDWETDDQRFPWDLEYQLGRKIFKRWDHEEADGDKAASHNWH